MRQSAGESDEEPDEGGQVEAPPGIEIPGYLSSIHSSLKNTTQAM